MPTVAVRIAQTLVARRLEGKVESTFHADSYGYRPGRSALDAVGVCRERCWRRDWVLDVDIQSFFDSVDHDLLLKAVEANTDQPGVAHHPPVMVRSPAQLQVAGRSAEKGTRTG